VRLIGAGLVGALIGYERRMHHKSIGIAGRYASITRLRTQDTSA
jgi:hypothetical protein